MSLHELVGLNLCDLMLDGVLNSTENAIKWLRKFGLISQERICHKCGSAMRLGRQANTADGQSWRCRKKECKTTSSIRKHSFFSRSNVSLVECIRLIFLWAEGDNSVGKICRYTKLCNHTVIDWCGFLREVCSEDLKINAAPIGGPGQKVAINETHVPRRKPGNPSSRDESMWRRKRSVQNFFPEILEAIKRQYTL
ncbi:uncharacterized protein LOC100181297 [Ciona intestinalis]